MTRVELAPGVDALASRCVWIEATRTLVLSDVHLGKPESFASLGAPMPARMHTSELARIASVVRATGAERVLVVGDLLHARAGLTPLLIDEVAQWRSEALTSVRWQLVPGNHDRSHARIAEAWGIDVLDHTVREGSVHYVHDPVDVPVASLDRGDVAICGHVHPVVCAGGLRGSLRAPCFVMDQAASGGHVVVMPAFTDFSRGAAMGPRPGRRILAVVGEALVQSPVQSGFAVSKS